MDRYAASSLSITLTGACAVVQSNMISEVIVYVEINFKNLNFINYYRIMARFDVVTSNTLLV